MIAIHRFKTSVLNGAFVFLLIFPSYSDGKTVPQLPTKPKAVESLRKAESQLKAKKYTDAYISARSSSNIDESNVAYEVMIKSMIYYDISKAVHAADLLVHSDNLTDGQVRSLATAYTWGASPKKHGNNWLSLRSVMSSMGKTAFYMAKYCTMKRTIHFQEINLKGLSNTTKIIISPVVTPGTTWV